VASVSVLHGIAAANARANLVETTQGLRRALARLATGLRLTNQREDGDGVARALAGRVGIVAFDSCMNEATAEPGLPEESAADLGADALRWSILSQSGIAAASQARQCSSAVVPLAH